MSIENMRKSRTLSDAELIKKGASYDKNGNLNITEDQHNKIKEEMKVEKLTDDLLKNFSIDEITMMANILESASFNAMQNHNNNPILKKLAKKIELCSNYAKKKKNNTKISS